MEVDPKNAKTELRERARERNRKEVDELREKYKEYMNWKDKGIEHELRTVFGIESASLSFLIGVTDTIIKAIGDKSLATGRQEKRHRDLMVGWMNVYWDRLQPFMHKLVIESSDHKFPGPAGERWKAYRSTHLTANLEDFLLYQPDEKSASSHGASARSAMIDMRQ